MKVSEAITKVALNMSLIAGNNMSPYSDDQVGQYLSNAHDMLTSKYTWPELVVVLTRTLTGTNGLPTVAYAQAGLTDYKQIRHVYSDNIRRELPIISPIVNPLQVSSLVGYQIMNIIDDPAKQYFVRILPLTTVGQIAIVANLKADFSNPDTVIPIDDLLHIWIATWMWAEDDGTNPGQAEKYSQLWQDRIKDVRSNVNQGPMALNPFSGPTEQWYEYDSP